MKYDQGIYLPLVQIKAAQSLRFLFLHLLTFKALKLRSFLLTTSGINIQETSKQAQLTTGHQIEENHYKNTLKKRARSYSHKSTRDAENGATVGEKQKKQLSENFYIIIEKKTIN
jgi:hypothetical protein